MILHCFLYFVVVAIWCSIFISKCKCGKSKFFNFQRKENVYFRFKIWKLSSCQSEKISEYFKKVNYWAVSSSIYLAIFGYFWQGFRQSSLAQQIYTISQFQETMR